MKPLRLFAALTLLSGVGCHSAFIEATISNRTDKPISLVELDYPSASFGTQTLAPGGEFHYRFKLLGSGDLKLLYTDATRTDHTVAGPHMSEGDEGSLAVAVTPTGVQWTPQLKAHR
jgi:hypothetical protein